MTFPEPLPHEPIRQVFDDVFFVTGRFRMAPLVNITRNMVIIRDGDALTLINAVRLTAQGERQLEELGKPRHLMKIGAFHDLDDPYYLDRYNLTFWAPPKAKHRTRLEVDEDLVKGCELPFGGGRLFTFENARYPEVAVLLDREGGILITCDSVQNIVSTRGMSVMGKLASRLMRLMGPARVGGPWRKAMQKPDGPPLRDDFDRLLQKPFRHLLSGHGPPLHDTAHTDLETHVSQIWPD